jgi:hypothetical protein
MSLWTQIAGNSLNPFSLSNCPGRGQTYFLASGRLLLAAGYLQSCFCSHLAISGLFKRITQSLLVSPESAKKAARSQRGALILLDKIGKNDINDQSI